MTTSTLHPAAIAYLRKVRREGRDLPRDRLAELVEDLEEHLATAIPAGATDDQAAEALRRLGDPGEVVAAARPEITVRLERRGAREWAAIFLLLFGFFAVVIGWIAGLLLLWSSRAWTTRDKVIGTLFLPGGLFTSAVLVLVAGGSAHEKKCISLGAGTHCTNLAGNSPSPVVSVVLVLLAVTPLASAVFLARRAG